MIFISNHDEISGYEKKEKRKKRRKKEEKKRKKEEKEKIKEEKKRLEWLWLKVKSVQDSLIDQIMIRSYLSPDGL